MSEGRALGVAVVSRMLFTVVDILLAGAAAISAWRVLQRHRSVGTQDVPASEPAA
jgi:hypothetical protein